jgi:hypothetical protein
MPTGVKSKNVKTASDLVLVVTFFGDDKAQWAPCASVAKHIGIN